MTDMKATMGETAVPSQSATPRHGGDLTALKAMPGAFAGNWLDLSTGINPLPWPVPAVAPDAWQRLRSEEHTSELQSLMRISYAVFCLKKKKSEQEQHIMNRYHTTRRIQHNAT